MKKFNGKGVYGAVAIGKISVFKKPDAAIKRVRVEDTEKEKKRVAQAKAGKYTKRRSKRSAKLTRRSSRYT